VLKNKNAIEDKNVKNKNVKRLKHGTVTAHDIQGYMNTGKKNIMKNSNGSTRREARNRNKIM